MNYGIPRAAPALLLLLGLTPICTASTALAQSLRDPNGWPMEGHDVRRTGQSEATGPRGPKSSGSAALIDEIAINMPPTIAGDGSVFVGTWGVIRSGGASDPAAWNKLDGAVFAFDRSLDPLWTFAPDHVPYCYVYPGRDEDSVPCPNGGTWNYYNGTVEGVGALNADQSVIYIGRGDGKLYAIDLDTGESVWTFRTFNPQDPEDPEGGGEVIAGPLVAPDGTIYIATVAAGEHETNAIYALSPEGTLLWRYPHSDKSMPNVVWASPALSPDGTRLYVGGGWGPAVVRDANIRGAIYAFDIGRAGGTGDERLVWRFEPINEAEWWKPTVWTTMLAVGSDGTIYASGPEYTLAGGSAVAFALRDLGTRAEYKWPRMVDLDRNRSSLTLGLALREVDGVTTRVYASSGRAYAGLSYPRGGKLYALDPATGEALWDAPFDPEAHGGEGSMTGIAIDAAGVIYTGVSGVQDRGKVFAIDAEGELLWSFEMGGLLEWGHPVIGPRGDLYFAETRRCPHFVQPIESGSCDGYDIDPKVYAIWKESTRRRPVRR